MRDLSKFMILPQPTETSCGPTCLHAIYQYYSEKITLDQVITEVPTLENGGTLAVHLACHALKRGFQASIYTYNLQLFDPVWFQIPSINIREKLLLQKKYKKNQKLSIASKAYLDFLDLNGKVLFQALTTDLINSFLKKSIPIMTGLSSTYLYRCAREMAKNGKSDDVKGVPSGHFVIIYGYDKKNKTVCIADPYDLNPLSTRRRYQISFERLIGAILLGIITYDANLLIIEPRKKG